MDEREDGIQASHPLAMEEGKLRERENQKSLAVQEWLFAVVKSNRMKCRARDGAQNYPLVLKLPPLLLAYMCVCWLCEHGVAWFCHSSTSAV